MFGKRRPSFQINTDAATSAPSSDARAPQNRELREPTFKSGVLYLEGGERLQVVVKNITAGGARIDFLQHTLLPEQVALSVANVPKRLARVIWQDEGSAGLEFV